jgi:tetratricopeptide (TPR) repeat protein
VAVESSRIEELRRRVGGDPASVAFAALAEEYRRAGRHDDAIATCLTGLARHPSYVSARVTLGRALVETGKYEDARIEFEHVLRMAPENLAAIRALASLHERFEDPVRAVETVSATVPSVSGPVDSTSVDTGVQAAPGAIATDSALSGLEAFLAAIKKSRRESQNPRGNDVSLT